MHHMRLATVLGIAPRNWQLLHACQAVGCLVDATTPPHAHWGLRVATRVRWRRVACKRSPSATRRIRGGGVCECAYGNGCNVPQRVLLWYSLWAVAPTTAARCLLPQWRPLWLCRCLLWRYSPAWACGNWMYTLNKIITIKTTWSKKNINQSMYKLKIGWRSAPRSAFFRLQNTFSGNCQTQTRYGASANQQ